MQGAQSILFQNLFFQISFLNFELDFFLKFEFGFNHLLLHCLIARELWSMVVTLFGIFWVMPKDVLDLLASWSGKFRKHKNGVLWNVIPHCLMWGIWREKNARTFEETEILIQDLKISFFQTLIRWTNALGVFFFTSLSDLLNRCRVRLDTAYFIEN